MHTIKNRVDFLFKKLGIHKQGTRDLRSISYSFVLDLSIAPDASSAWLLLTKWNRLEYQQHSRLSLHIHRSIQHPAKTAAIEQSHIFKTRVKVLNMALDARNLIPRANLQRRVIRA
jgi:hypothetical protein